jgi:hypothetical protein
MPQTYNSEAEYALARLQKHREQCRINAKKRYNEYKKLKEASVEVSSTTTELSREEQMVAMILKSFDKESLQKIALLISKNI